MIAQGWHVRRVIGVDLPPPGGRIFFTGIPHIWQNQYATTYGTTEAAHAEVFLVDIVKWLRGGRTSGVVAMMVNTDNVWPATPDAVWGSRAQAALTAAGFTVTTFSVHAQNAAEIISQLPSCDVLLAATLVYNGGAYAPNGAQSTTLYDWVNVNDGAILAFDSRLFGTSPTAPRQLWGFATTQGYAHQTGYNRVVLNDYTGAEAIFANTFSGGSAGLYMPNSGGTTYAYRARYEPVGGGETYPNSRHPQWPSLPATGSRYKLFCAFTAHADAGVGEDWAIG